MKILIDIGNQRVKWATSDQICCLDNKRVEDLVNLKPIKRDQIIETNSKKLVETLTTQFEKLPMPDSIWASCVSVDATKAILDKICTATWERTPNYLQSDACARGVRNGYEDPITLGIDRWAAIIAAKDLVGLQSTIVIDAGTAVTVDYVAGDGQFVGGVIFPGIVTMISSLNTSTGQISSSTRSGEGYQLEVANTNTQSAVENGVLLSIISGIDQAIDNHLLAADHTSKIIITGGDARRILTLSKHTMQIEPDLVLMGILCLSEEAV